MSAYFVPPPDPPFVGRDDAIKKLVSLQDLGVSSGTGARVMVHGKAGIGSSSLVYVYASRFRERFPAGVLYLQVGDSKFRDLLGLALHQLGVPLAEIPANEQERSSTFMRLIEGRQVLMVLDGVSNANEIDKLLPSSATAVVIATTRVWLRALSASSWSRVPLERLTDHEARALLRTMLSDDADAIPEPVLTALLTGCCGHPTAIRMVAGVLDGQPEYAERLAEQIHEFGVGDIEVDGKKLVSALLDSLYHDAMSESLQRAYRRLSAHPGAGHASVDFSLAAAQEILGLDEQATERIIRELRDRHVLEFGRDRRIRQDSLVRAHARALACSLDAAADRRLRGEIINWYRVAGIGWEKAITFRWRACAAYDQIPAVGPIEAATRTNGLAWLTAERVNLEAAATDAVDIHDDRSARDLGFVLWTPQHLLGYSSATADVMMLSRDAAERLRDDAAVMQLTAQIGAGSFATGDLEAAENCYSTSLDMARRLGHGFGEQSALEWLGKIAAKRGLFAVAFQYYDQSQGVALTPGKLPAEEVARALALLALHRGRAHLSSRQWIEAAAFFRAALTHFEQTTEGDNHAKALYGLGQALRGLDDLDAARAVLEKALDLFTTDKSLRRQAETHEALAAGVDRTATITHLRAAETLYTLLGDARAADIRKRLTPLGE